MLESLRRPMIFAHRGASMHAPENTLAAFDLAVKVGAPALELDTKLTRDEQVVVLHDATVNRTTDGQGSIKDLLSTEIRKLDAGTRFDKRFRGERIPLLEDVIESFSKRVLLNIELGNYRTPGDGLPERVCEIVRRHAAQGAVMFSSFLARNLARTARLLPSVPTGLLAMRGWRGAWARSFGFDLGDFAALHPHVADVTPQQVQRVHKLRRRLHVWTANDLADIRRLRDWGVDGIMTDDPEGALAALGMSK